MKQLPASWAALSVLVPVLVALTLIFLPMGCGGGGGTSPAPAPSPTGNVEVGFINPDNGSVNVTPMTGYRSILLNVLAIRLNPSTNPNVSDLDPGWVSITVPAGVGTQPQVVTLGISGGLSFFGLPGPGTTGTGASELQIDLNAIQSQAQLFNTGPVPPNTYNQIELLLDSSNPGNVVPSCAQSASGAEGCITYGVTLASPTTPIRTTAPVTVGQGGLTTLVLNLSLSTPPVPPVPPNPSSGTYTIDPVISVAPNSSLGLLQGTVSGATLKSETVTAELSGTNTIVAIAKVLSDGSYSMGLPAGPSGIAYDLYASGTGTTIDPVSGVTITPGNTITQNFTVSSEGASSVTGTLVSGCAPVQPIQGATLILYLPGDGKSVTCTDLPTPAGCVAVASAATDDTGTYPLPGMIGAPPPFQTVPTDNYSLKLSAAGFDPLTSAVTISAGKVTCAGSTSTSNCSFSLTSAQITGTVSLGSPAASAVDVMMMAEDHGTNNIENFGTATVPAGTSSAPFTVRVPSTVASFDLFASSEDLFASASTPSSGVQETNSGHTIAVLAGVPGASACGTSSGISLEASSCVGHGSVTGTAASFDPETTIELSKQDPFGTPVQLMSSTVGPSGSLNAGAFSFCAPADPSAYSLQRFESGSPAASPTTTTLLAPTPIPTPCSSICFTGSSSCLLCVNTGGVVVP